MKQEIILLVYYINISNIPSGELEEYIYRIHEQFDQIIWPDNFFVKIFLIPVNDQKTHIECVYPLNMNDESTNKAFRALSNASEQLIKFVKDALTNNKLSNKPQ
jgi:hypothetical protein